MRRRAAGAKRRLTVATKVLRGQDVATLAPTPGAGPSASPAEPRWPLDRGAVPDGAVDVRQLMETYTVEQLAESAEAYYQQNVGNPDYYLAKPLGNVDEASDLLICMGQILGVLRPTPGMRVLDFGAGTAWTTRWLTQLGCSVVACDVSETALGIGRRLFEQLPPVGEVTEPEFLLFDGHHVDLPDASVDRVLGFEVLHHVPNLAEVLAELQRVLAPGGIAAFAEPGPRHSLTTQSQFEMRNFEVIENDIVVSELQEMATAAGFDRIEFGVFAVSPFTLTADEYVAFITGDHRVGEYLDHVRGFIASRTNLFAFKEGEVQTDSRDQRGLLARVEVSLDDGPIPAGGRITGVATVENTGTGRWIGSGDHKGLVQLGVHLYGADGKLVDRDFGRLPLPDGRSVEPGATVRVPVALDAPEPGRYTLAFDMVSEAVCWFEINGTVIQEVPIEVG